MKLKIVAKKARNNNVRLLISYAHQTRHLFATGVSIPPSDFKAGQIERPVARTNANADHFNNLITLLYHEILSIISKLRREDNVPTGDLVHYIYNNKSLLDRRMLNATPAVAASKPTSNDRTTVIDYSNDISNDEDEGSGIKASSRSTKEKKSFHVIYREFLDEKAFTAATLKLYTPMYTRLMECFPNLDIEKFDGSAWMKFRKHLEKEGLAANTVCIRMNKAKAMFKYLKQEAGYNIPVRSFPLPKEEVKKIFLNMTDLKKVINYSAVTESLDRTKDLLLFQCHTGLRISDLKRVNERHFQQVDDNYFIQMNAFKTNVPLMIPLNSNALAVLHKYDFNLPEMTEQAYNREIKSLLKKAGVTTTVEWRAYDTKGNKIFKSGKVCEVFTNHCCSRTAIRYFFSVGYTPDQVSRIVGKSLETIMSYYLETASQNEIVERTEQLVARS
jgi:integrase